MDQLDMDQLDRLARPAADLLARVDDLLAAAGAAGEHRIWPLLRRCRALPGDAVAALVALRPEPFTEAGAELRALVQRYDDLPDALAVPVGWAGPAADSFAAQRSALRAYLSDGPESLTGRWRATADHADALAHWVVGSRRALAATLAEVLGSVEAVLVVTAGEHDPTGGATAAAEIGARVLATVAECVDRSVELSRRWAPRLAESDPPPLVELAGRPGGVLRVDHR